MNHRFSAVVGGLSLGLLTTAFSWSVVWASEAWSTDTFNARCSATVYKYAAKNSESSVDPVSLAKILDAYDVTLLVVPRGDGRPIAQTYRANRCFDWASGIDSSFSLGRTYPVANTYSARLAKNHDLSPYLRGSVAVETKEVSFPPGADIQLVSTIDKNSVIADGSYVIGASDPVILARIDEVITHGGMQRTASRPAMSSTDYLLNPLCQLLFGVLLLGIFIRVTVRQNELEGDVVAHRIHAVLGANRRHLTLLNCNANAFWSSVGAAVGYVLGIFATSLATLSLPSSQIATVSFLGGLVSVALVIVVDLITAFTYFRRRYRDVLDS